MFLQLSVPEQLLLLEASAWMAAARLAILALPFRWVAPLLGRPRASSPCTVTPRERDALARVKWAVFNAHARVPWECKCLVRAIAAKRMLAMRRVRSTLYLGAKRDDPVTLSAHAWVRVGDVVLFGRRMHGQFSGVSTFA